MNVERINPTELARPSGFSHAVSVNEAGAEAGRLVFLAGQIGIGRDGKVVVGGVVPQFEQALGNLLTALAAAGGQPGDLVSLTVYLVDVEDYQAHGHDIGAVLRRLAGAGDPAMAGVGGTPRGGPAALVRNQGTALVNTPPVARCPPAPHA